MGPCASFGTVADLIVPLGTKEEIRALKSNLLENARLQESGASL